MGTTRRTRGGVFAGDSGSWRARVHLVAPMLLDNARGGWLFAFEVSGARYPHVPPPSTTRLWIFICFPKQNPSSSRLLVVWATARHENRAVAKTDRARLSKQPGKPARIATWRRRNLTRVFQVAARAIALLRCNDEVEPMRQVSATPARRVSAGRDGGGTRRGRARRARGRRPTTRARRRASRSRSRRCCRGRCR
jgi:hypothetical protein